MFDFLRVVIPFVINFCLGFSFDELLVPMVKHFDYITHRDYVFERYNFGIGTYFWKFWFVASLLWS